VLMKATESDQPTIVRVMLSAIVTAVVFPGLTLLLAGTWRWLEGWVFGLWFDAMVLSNVIYMYRNDPALLAERSKRPGSDNQKTWDAYLLSAIYAISTIWLVIMPLDAVRFHWSPPFPIWLEVLGGLLLLPSLYLIYRATAENT